MGVTMFNSPLGEQDDDLQISEENRPKPITQLGMKPRTAPGTQRNRAYNFASSKETGTAALDKIEIPTS